MKNTSDLNVIRVLFNVNSNSSSNIIKFDLRSLNPNETILDVEMFLYLQMDNVSQIFEKSVVIRVYQFEKHANGAFNESILVENPDIHKLFNVIYISKARRGWQVGILQVFETLFAVILFCIGLQNQETDK